MSDSRQGEAQMIAVIFEVEPAEGQMDHYLDHAAGLRPVLETMPGFISVERFRSLTNPAKLLSLSFWADEAAVANWRNQEKHRVAQSAGRHGVFAGWVAEGGGGKEIRTVGLEQDRAVHL